MFTPKSWVHLKAVFVESRWPLRCPLQSRHKHESLLGTHFPCYWKQRSSHFPAPFSFVFLNLFMCLFSSLPKRVCSYPVSGVLWAWSKAGIFCSNLVASEKESHTFCGLFSRFRGWAESEEKGQTPSWGGGQEAGLFPLVQRALQDLTCLPPLPGPSCHNVLARTKSGSSQATSALSPLASLPVPPHLPRMPVWYSLTWQVLPWVFDF